MHIDKLELHYRLLKILDGYDLTQRQMAAELDLSLGKFNYCLKALIKKGFVKVDRFTTSDNKPGYLYLLTPKGIEEKSVITVSFLKRKIREFEEIKQQIEELKQEVSEAEIRA